MVNAMMIRGEDSVMGEAGECTALGGGERWDR